MAYKDIVSKVSEYLSVTLPDENRGGGAVGRRELSWLGFGSASRTGSADADQTNIDKLIGHDADMQNPREATTSTCE